MYNNNNNNKGFQFEVRSDKLTVLSKLILVGTVKLRTLSKAAVVAKRVAKASSLRSAEPAFDLPIPFSGSSFIGVQTPEYMAPIDQPAETLDQWPNSVIIGGREAPSRGPCFTVLGTGEKLHPAFL